MFRMMLAGALISLMVPVAANAAEVEIRMLNKGAAGVMVFEPAFVRVAPGDTVKFIAADKGHNAESVPEMLPAGAAAVVGRINEEVSITFTEPGVYGIKCKPHYSMGMVALVVVGEPGNLDAAKAARHPGRARQAFATLLEQAEHLPAQAAAQ